MYKISPLSKQFKGSAFIINEETISLGNSVNTSLVFRKHRFSVIRPNLIGFIHNEDIDLRQLEQPEKKKSLAKRMFASIKNVTINKKIDSNYQLDLSLMPDYVLVNPSQWGTMVKRNKDGSTHDVDSDGDFLIPLKKFISYEEGKTISLNLRLKETNV